MFRSNRNLIKYREISCSIMALFSLSRTKEDRLAWLYVRSNIMKRRIQAGAWLGRRTRLPVHVVTKSGTFELMYAFIRDEFL